MKSELPFIRIQNRSLPIDLSTILSLVRKDDLDAIRKQLGIKNHSRSTKGKLVETLALQIPDAIQKIFTFFDVERYTIFKEISLSSKGLVRAEKFPPHKLKYFSVYGLAFPIKINNRLYLMAPIEVIEAFRQIDNENYLMHVNENTEMIQIAHGMLYFYGVIRFSKLVGLLGHYFNLDQIEENLPRILETLIHGDSYYARALPYEDYYCYSLIANPQRIIASQQAFPELDYYYFNKEDLIRVGSQSLFIPNTKEYRAFIKFLKQNWEVNNKDISDITRKLFLLIQTEPDRTEMFSQLLDSLEISSLTVIQQLWHLVIGIRDNIHLWGLKGHYLPLFHESELDFPVPGNVYDFDSKKHDSNRFGNKPIKDDELCPCGSGKEFKNCCGRNDK